MFIYQVVLSRKQLVSAGGIPTIIDIFNFTLDVLTILHAAFFLAEDLLFGIPNDDFQRKNCSADVA